LSFKEEMTMSVMAIKKTKYMALSGLLAAMTFVVTMIHVPTGNGYTHAGDGVIYLAASILPMPYAVAASAIGGLMADGLSGAAIWIPATIIIKAVTALFFSSKTEKIVCTRNIIGIIPSFIICVLGYSIYEAIFILGDFSWAVFGAAMTQLPSYIVQIAASSILYITVGLILDKMKLKSRYL